MEKKDHLAQVQEYWDRRSHGFSDAINEELDSQLGKAWIDRFSELFGEEPLDILDDGAGAGFFSMILASLGHRVTSIDYSPEMVEYIKSNMENRKLSCLAYKMDAQDLAFDDSSFDAVVQRNVMWNLDYPDIAYSEIFRVLRPGGIFIIDDGNYYLSAHDEDYAKEAEARKAQFEAMKKSQDVSPGSHYKHNPENVDFGIIEKIAVEQPLSFQRRPQWDIDQMIRLGVKDISVQIDSDGLPKHFLIIARKPR